MQQPNQEDNKELMKHSKSLTNSNQKEVNPIIGILKINYACDNKFDYNDAQLGYWAKRITEIYPLLTNEKLIKVMQKGTEGRYKSQYEGSVNFSVVVGWIDRFLKEETIEWLAKFTKDCIKSADMRMNIDQFYKANPQNEDYLNFLISENKINSPR